MTTLYSDIATIENAPTPGTLTRPNVNRGKARFIAPAIELDAAADGDIVRLCKLYPGDVVTLGPSFIATESTIGNSATVKVGDTDDTDTADDDRYLESTSIASAAVVQFNDATACLSKVPYVIQKECWLIATLGASGAITGNLRAEIFIGSDN